MARKLKANRAPLNPAAIETEPFKKIAIDIVGELPRTTTSYKYILTIVDYATRYPEAIPLRSAAQKRSQIPLYSISTGLVSHKNWYVTSDLTSLENLWHSSMIS